MSTPSLDDILTTLGILGSNDPELENFYLELTGDNANKNFNDQTNSFVNMMTETFINPQFQIAVADLKTKRDEVNAELVHDVIDKCKSKRPDEENWQRRFEYILKNSLTAADYLQTTFDSLGEKSEYVFRIVEMLTTLPNIQDVQLSDLLKPQLLQYLAELWPRIYKMCINLHDLFAPQLLFKKRTQIESLVSDVRREIVELHDQLRKYWIFLTKVTSSNRIPTSSSETSTTTAKATKKTVSAGVRVLNAETGQELIVTPSASRSLSPRRDLQDLNASDLHRATTVTSAHSYSVSWTSAIAVTLLGAIGWYSNVRTDVNWYIVYQGMANSLTTAVFQFLGYDPSIGLSGVSGLPGFAIYRLVSFVQYLLIGTQNEVPWWAQFIEYVIRQAYIALPVSVVTFGYFFGFVNTATVIYNFVQLHFVIPQRNAQLQRQVEELQNESSLTIRRRSLDANELDLLTQQVTQQIMENLAARRTPIAQQTLLIEPSRNAARGADEEPIVRSTATSSTILEEELPRPGIPQPAAAPIRRRRNPAARGESPPPPAASEGRQLRTRRSNLTSLLARK